MTGAELRCARAALGLTTALMAEALDVQEKTLRAWERDAPIPEGVAADVEELFTQRDAMTVDAIDETLIVPSAGWRTPEDMMRLAAAHKIARETGMRIAYDDLPDGLMVTGEAWQQDRTVVLNLAHEHEFLRGAAKSRQAALKSACRRALDHGQRVQDVAAWAGVSRQQLRKWMREDEGDS